MLQIESFRAPRWELASQDLFPLIIPKRELGEKASDVITRKITTAVSYALEGPYGEIFENVDLTIIPVIGSANIAISGFDFSFVGLVSLEKLATKYTELKWLPLIVSYITVEAISKNGGDGPRYSFDGERLNELTGNPLACNFTAVYDDSLFLRSNLASKGLTPDSCRHIIATAVAKTQACYVMTGRLIQNKVDLLIRSSIFGS